MNPQPNLDYPTPDDWRLRVERELGSLTQKVDDLTSTVGGMAQSSKVVETLLHEGNARMERMEISIGAVPGGLSDLNGRVASLENDRREAKGQTAWRRQPLIVAVIVALVTAAITIGAARLTDQVSGDASKTAALCAAKVQTLDDALESGQLSDAQYVERVKPLVQQGCIR